MGFPRPAWSFHAVRESTLAAGLMQCSAVCQLETMQDCGSRAGAHLRISDMKVAAGSGLTHRKAIFGFCSPLRGGRCVKTRKNLKIGFAPTGRRGPVCRHVGAATQAARVAGAAAAEPQSQPECRHCRAPPREGVLHLRVTVSFLESRWKPKHVCTCTCNI